MERHPLDMSSRTHLVLMKLGAPLLLPEPELSFNVWMQWLKLISMKQ